MAPLSNQPSPLVSLSQPLSTGPPSNNPQTPMTLNTLSTQSTPAAATPAHYSASTTVVDNVIVDPVVRVKQLIIKDLRQTLMVNSQMMIAIVCCRMSTSWHRN